MANKNYEIYISNLIIKMVFFLQILRAQVSDLGLTASISEIWYLLLQNRDTTEILLKRHKSSNQLHVPTTNIKGSCKRQADKVPCQNYITCE